MRTLATIIIVLTTGIIFADETKLDESNIAGKWVPPDENKSATKYAIEIKNDDFNLHLKQTDLNRGPTIKPQIDGKIAIEHDYFILFVDDQPIMKLKLFKIDQQTYLLPFADSHEKHTNEIVINNGLIKLSQEPKKWPTFAISDNNQTTEIELGIRDITTEPPNKTVEENRSR